MEVNLSPEAENLIRKCAGSNGLTAPSDVIEVALRNYGEVIAEREEILRALQESDEQLARGDYIDLDGPEELHEFFEEIKREGRRRLGLDENQLAG